MALKYKDLMMAYSNALADKSLLYSKIARYMAEDKELKELLSPYLNVSRFIPLMMTANLSLLYEHDDPLRQYYVNFTPEPKEFDDEGFVVFKNFVNKHFHEMMSLVRSGDLKKNIVERSALLIPIFHYINEQINNKVFNVIELGSKAGLLLNYDWYGYTFNKDHKIGHSDDINIKMKIKGYPYETLLPLAHPHYKFGLSDKVVRLEDDSSFNWMLSQLYPEETKRRKNLTKARDIFLQHPVQLVEGDELALLDQTLDALPDNEAVIIFHVHHAKNWSDEKKMALLELIQRFSATKEIYHIHHQLFDSDVFIDYMNKGVFKREKLANLDLDKMKIEWLLGQPLKL